MSDILLGTEDRTDAHSGQAPANNYVKHTGYQVGVDAREESKAEATTVLSLLENFIMATH